MTPDEYITQISEMVAARQDAEALEFARAHRNELDPPLTVVQNVYVADTLHMASAMIDLDEHAAREETEQAEVA